jgi:hypothetical protein
MSYFNHAFRKTFVGTNGFVDNLSGHLGTPGNILQGGEFAFVNAKTWALQTTAPTNCCNLVLAAGSIYQNDKIGPFHGGYKETNKSKEINPKYVSRFYRVDPCTPQNNVIHIGNTAYTDDVALSLAITNDGADLEDGVYTDVLLVDPAPATGSGLVVNITVVDNVVTFVEIVNGGTGLSTIPTNGQLLIGNGTGYTLNTLGFGAGISVTNGSGTISVTNTLPDQVVALTGAGTTVVTGTYPNFTITSSDAFVGTVTSVSVVSANGFAGTVATSTTTPAITLTTSITGLLKGNGTAISAAVANTDYQGVAAPVTKTADFTVANGDIWHINNKSGSTCTVTLPAAASWTGRQLVFKNMQAQTLVSASSNVVPLDSTSAGTAILLDVVGNWATMVSDGTNWVIMQAASNNNLLLE